MIDLYVVVEGVDGGITFEATAWEWRVDENLDRILVITHDTHISYFPYEKVIWLRETRPVLTH